MTSILELMRTLRSADLTADLQEAEDILEHAHRGIGEDACTVALLGEWSRGKTTVINALLGDPSILPTDVRPTTASLVTIRHGDVKIATIHRKNGQFESKPMSPELLSLMQTEETGGSKNNDVVRVDIQRDLGELSAIRIVDTPGVNDLRETPEELVYKFLPFVDLAVFVLDATNGGLTASEKKFLQDKVIGPLAPKILFLVNHMDRLECEDDDEAEEFKEDVIAGLTELLGHPPRVLYGTAAPGLKSTSITIEQLKKEFLSTAEQSVFARRKRILGALFRDLENLLTERSRIFSAKTEELETKLTTLKQSRHGMTEAFASFRQQVNAEGEVPLLKLIEASLAEFKRTSQRHLDRQIALNGQLSAYAKHGLPADFEMLVRGWVDRYTPEIMTFLTRHAGFVNQEYGRVFGGQTSIAPPSLNVRMPATHANPLIDSKTIKKREDSASQQRIIVPAILAVIGLSIAAPVGIAAAYGGSLLGTKWQNEAQEVLRSDLTKSARALLDRKVEEMQNDFQATIASYFKNLDEQLEQSFQSQLNATTRAVEHAKDLRSSAAGQNEREQANLKIALQKLLEFKAEAQLILN
jgi:hypothetical protein